MSTDMVLVGLAALCAGGMCGCVVLFAMLKRDVGAAERRRKQGNESALAGLRTEIARLNEEVLALQARAAEAPEAIREAPPAFNLTRRSQALQLHRRGLSPEQIAHNLGLTPCEVQLLIKVHRMVLDTA